MPSKIVSYGYRAMQNRYLWLRIRFKTWSFDEIHLKRRDVVGNRRVWSLTIAVGIAALTSLCLMVRDPTYLLAALLAGTTAMAIDFVIEYTGIVRRRWNYPRAGQSLRTVPLEVPLLFLFCGIIATFITLQFSEEPLRAIVSQQLAGGLGLVQAVLLVIASCFILQYALGAIRTLVFWALPLSIALYISFPEPWMLAVSILPVYVDYYLERRLVKSSDITYDGYDDDVAVNVSISYFPTTLLILGIAASLLHLLGLW